MTGLPPISTSGLGFRAVSSDSLVPSPPARMATGGEAERIASDLSSAPKGKRWKCGGTIVTGNSLPMGYTGSYYLIEKKRKEKYFFRIDTESVRVQKKLQRNVAIPFFCHRLLRYFELRGMRIDNG